MTQEVNSYLDKLGISKRGELVYDDKENVDKLVIILDDSNEFARIYTQLDKADWLEQVEGDFSLKDENSSLIFINDDFKFTLKANLLSDLYMLEVEER